MKNQILVAGLQGWFNFHINAASLLIIGPTVAFAVKKSFHEEKYLPLTRCWAHVVLRALPVLSVYFWLIYWIWAILWLWPYKFFQISSLSLLPLKDVKPSPSKSSLWIKFLYVFNSVEVESAPYTQLPVANYTGEAWPENGQIEIKNYYAKYRPNLPFVIKDLSIRIRPSEKVGVVGRTGSGKSTTLLCLLRIIESKKGQILIDDVDISQLGLDDLRRKITIIPQVRILFWEIS